MAVRTAEKLLKEVRPKSPAASQRASVLETYVLLASKSKQNSEKALGRLSELATTEVRLTLQE